MYRLSKLKFFTTMLFLLFFLPAAVVIAGDEIYFSGVVKKIISNKNKVGIKDPKTKKRFTVIVNEKKPDGLKTLEILKKKNKVEGAYVVTDAGLYIAVKLERNKLIYLSEFLEPITNCSTLFFRQEKVSD